MKNLRPLLMLTLLLPSSPLFADECDTQSMACKVGCTNKYGPPPFGNKDDPMMLRDCNDSCDAAERLCKEYKKP
jgi:hypothetical protein